MPADHIPQCHISLLLEHPQDGVSPPPPWAACSSTSSAEISPNIWPKPPFYNLKPFPLIQSNKPFLKPNHTKAPYYNLFRSPLKLKLPNNRRNVHPVSGQWPCSCCWLDALTVELCLALLQRELFPAQEESSARLSCSEASCGSINLAFESCDGFSSSTADVITCFICRFWSSSEFSGDIECSLHPLSHSIMTLVIFYFCFSSGSC